MPEPRTFTICARCWSVVGVDGENNEARAPVLCSHLGPFIQATEDAPLSEERV